MASAAGVPLGRTLPRYGAFREPMCFSARLLWIIPEAVAPPRAHPRLHVHRRQTGRPVGLPISVNARRRITTPSAHSAKRPISLAARFLPLRRRQRFKQNENARRKNELPQPERRNERKLKRNANSPAWKPKLVTAATNDCALSPRYARKPHDLRVCGAAFLAPVAGFAPLLFW